MKNVKITYTYTNDYEHDGFRNASCGYGFDPVEDIVIDREYDFQSYLQDNFEIWTEREDNIYYVVTNICGCCGERTGEAYMVLSEEETDEEIIG